MKKTATLILTLGWAFTGCNLLMDEYELSDGGLDGSDSGTDTGWPDTDTNTNTGTDTDVDSDSDTDTDTDGPFAWAKWVSFFGPEANASATEIAVDDTGVYVVGWSEEPWNGPDDQPPLLEKYYGPTGYYLFVLKLGPDGDYLWHTFFDVQYIPSSTGHSQDLALAADETGIYIAEHGRDEWTGPDGQQPIIPASEDFSVNNFILKLSADGAYLWHTFFPSSSNQDCPSLVTDGNGVYLGGICDDSWNGPQGESPIDDTTADAYSRTMYIVKLGSDGAYAWHTFQGISLRSVAEMASDDSGIYVASWSSSIWDGPGGEPPIDDPGAGTTSCLLKLGKDGSYLWHTFHGQGLICHPTGLALDSGNVFLGMTECDLDGNNPFNEYNNGAIKIVSVDSGGVYRWHTSYGADNGPTIGEATLSMAAYEGYIYPVGAAAGSWDVYGKTPLHVGGGGKNAMIIKLASGGGYTWHTFHGGEEDQVAYDVSLDSTGLYILGAAAGALPDVTAEEECSHSSCMFVLKHDF